MSWIREIESPQTIDDMRTSQSIAGNQYSNDEIWDVTVATASKSISTSTSFLTKKSFGRTESPKADRFLRGRQIAYMMLDISDLMSVTLRGDGIQGFDTKWDEVLNSMKEFLQNDAARFRPLLPWKNNTMKNGEPASYTRLKNMVNKNLDQTNR